jgi:hypothetical protein
VLTVGWLVAGGTAATFSLMGEEPPARPDAENRSRVNVIYAPTPSGSAGVSSVSGGLRVYRDPNTGQLAAPPQDNPAWPLLLTPGELNALSRSSAGLVEEAVTVPAGGFKVNLQGRFMSAGVVVAGTDGRMRRTCTAIHAGLPVGEGNYADPRRAWVEAQRGSK